MNKAELIEAVSGRLGDRKSATAAIEAVLTEIQNAVTKGDKVSIAGFGVFEKRDRAARTARNPRTGEAVKVKKTSVPAFRPGQTFKELVAAGKLPKVAATAKKTAAAAPAKKVAAAPAKVAVAKKAAAPVKAAPVKAAPVKAAPVKAAPAKSAPAKKAPARTAAATAPAKKAAGRTTRGK